MPLAHEVGETKEYYYCDGRYKAPEFDEFNVITRYVWKDYTIGFDVEEQAVGTWVDSTGVTHVNETVYYLRLTRLKETCYVA